MLGCLISIISKTLQSLSLSSPKIFDAFSPLPDSSMTLLICKQVRAGVLPDE